MFDQQDHIRSDSVLQSIMHPPTPPKLLCSLVALAIILPAAMAGEWVVETHSIVVRAPAAIAGVEDAAIGNVSELPSQQACSRSTLCCAAFPFSNSSVTAVWGAVVWSIHAG